jgi:hypothetical protein
MLGGVAANLNINQIVNKVTVGARVAIPWSVLPLRSIPRQKADRLCTGIFLTLTSFSSILQVIVQSFSVNHS